MVYRLLKLLVLLALYSACFVPISQAQEKQLIRPRLDLLPKKELNKKKLGISAFVNDQRFGTISAQFREVKGTLGIKYVRVLFYWNDLIQPTPSSTPFWGFYDEIAKSLPSGVQALVIVNGAPSWMSNPANWIDNNPRKTFVKYWLEPVVKRYAKNTKIKAYQVWNEPNMASLQENQILQVVNSPENYVELLALSQNVIKQNSPKKKVVAAATTAINQNYPESLDYNKAMLAAGIEQFADIYALHFYSMHLENFYRPDNILDFTAKIKKPIWVTESGEQGYLKQKEYAQRMWPFLFQAIPNIKRLYIYQFTEATSSSSTYGLRNLTKGSNLSDLYIYLRSMKAKKR